MAETGPTDSKLARKGDRRAGDRRRVEIPFAGDDRRTGDRRSGRERRAH